MKAVLSEDFKERTEETYDIYLLPPGEDPEACQSYLRMRNRDGKYNLMFEVCLILVQTSVLMYKGRIRLRTDRQIHSNLISIE